MCFQLRQRGNYCPLCQKCYETDDYETKASYSCLFIFTDNQYNIFALDDGMCNLQTLGSF